MHLKVSRRCIKYTIVVSGVLTVATTFFAIFGVPALIDLAIKSNMQVKEGSMLWDMFVDLPFPINFNVRMFEITNPGPVQNEKANPILIEKGPYVYSYTRSKYDIQLQGEVASYYQKHLFEFNREATSPELSEEDEITTLNFVIIGLYQILEHVSMQLPFNVEEVLADLLEDSNLIQKAKVKSILFSGYNLCDQSKIQLQSKIVCLVIMLLNLKMIDYHEDLSMTYSFFGFKNNTDDGLFTINSGIEDIEKLGQLQMWNNMTYTNFWKKGEKTKCDRVEGVDVTLYPPHMKKENPLLIYLTDLSRSIKLKFEKESKFKDIHTYSYRMNELFYPESGEKREDSCFCTKKTKNAQGDDSCYLDGLLDMYSVLGIPALASFPHYLYADEKYSKDLIGIEPNEEKHGSYMQFQPFLGIPASGAIRLQLNIVTRPATLYNEVVPSLANLGRYVYPLLWFEVDVELNDEYYGLVNTLVTLLAVANIGKWVLVGLAATFLLLSSLVYYKMKK